MSNSQWDNIINRLGGKEDFSIDTFRGNPKYMLYGTFDPRKFGALYLKTFIFSQLNNGTELFKKLLFSINNRDIGVPYGINSCGEFVCLDYVTAAHECEFISPVMNNIKTVVEIGAGYGRTCHAILSNYDLKNYFIIDLPFSLDISTQYLKRVLCADKYSKITFVSNEDYAVQLKDMFCSEETLFINIDSMGEMPVHVVDEYLNYINKTGRFFYCNNTLGKYDPCDVGERVSNKAVVNTAIQSGKMPGTINIFDVCALRDRVPSFVEEYRPSKSWRVQSEEFTSIYPHYYQVIYVKEHQSS